MSNFDIKRGGLRIVCEHSPSLRGREPVMEIAPILAAIGKGAMEVGKRVAAGVGGAAAGLGAGALNAGKAAVQTVGTAVPKLASNFANDVSGDAPDASTPPAPPTPKFSWTR